VCEQVERVGTEPAQRICSQHLQDARLGCVDPEGETIKDSHTELFRHEHVRRVHPWPLAERTGRRLGREKIPLDPLNIQLPPS
jgi:hypothetical protein